MKLYHQHAFPYHAMTLPPPPPWAEDGIIVIDIEAPTPTTTTATSMLLKHQQQKEEIDRLTEASTTTTSTILKGLDTLPHFFAVWGVVVVLVAMAVVTVVSNSTMLTMFVLRRSVRRCKNIYIASLAAADLGIGLTLPVAALEQVENRWVLEGVACHLYQTVRCSLLYVSLLSILLITVDRWWSIHYPFTYRVRQSKKLAAVAVVLVWITSFALHVPPILLWDYFIGESSETFPAPANADLVISMQEAHPAKQLSSSSSSSPLSLLSVLTTVRTSVSTTTPLTPDRQRISVFLSPESEGFGPFINTKDISSDRQRCELPYNLHFSFVLTVSVVLYFFPLLALWVLNCSLYFKITRRKSIKIRRSLSVNDNYLLAFRKSSSESESSPNNGTDCDASGVELRSAEHRQRLVSAARAGRRHTLAFPGHPHAKLTGGAGSVYYPSQTIFRHHSCRRVSLHEAFSGMGSNLAAVGSGVPHLPRVTSCGRFSNSMVSGNSGSSMVPSYWFGTGHRQSVCSSSRKQSDDLVKELLVRQDKKAARLLGLLVTVFTLCWLPYTVTLVLHASDPTILVGWLRDLTFWVLVTNSAINPFLYGLLNAEFRKILRDWFYFRRQSAYRLKHALLYWSLPANGDSDGLKEAPTSHAALFATPIKE